MSRTYRRKTIPASQWRRNLWSDHKWSCLCDENDPRALAFYHTDWRYIPHHPPKVVRRQLERRYRQRLANDLRHIQHDRLEILTSPRFPRGIGWFWNW